MSFVKCAARPSHVKHMTVCSKLPIKMADLRLIATYRHCTNKNSTQFLIKRFITPDGHPKALSICLRFFNEIYSLLKKTVMYNVSRLYALLKRPSQVLFTQ